MFDRPSPLSPTSEQEIDMDADEERPFGTEEPDADFDRYLADCRKTSESDFSSSLSSAASSRSLTPRVVRFSLDRSEGYTNNNDIPFCSPDLLVDDTPIQLSYVPTGATSAAVCPTSLSIPPSVPPCPPTPSIVHECLWSLSGYHSEVCVLDEATGRWQQTTNAGIRLCERSGILSVVVDACNTLTHLEAFVNLVRRSATTTTTSLTMASGPSKTPGYCVFAVQSGSAVRSVLYSFVETVHCIVSTFRYRTMRAAMNVACSFLQANQEAPDMRQLRSLIHLRQALQAHWIPYLTLLNDVVQNIIHTSTSATVSMVLLDGLINTVRQAETCSGDLLVYQSLYAVLLTTLLPFAVELEYHVRYGNDLAPTGATNTGAIFVQTTAEEWNKVLPSFLRPHVESILLASAEAHRNLALVGKELSRGQKSAPERCREDSKDKMEVFVVSEIMENVLKQSREVLSLRRNEAVIEANIFPNMSKPQQCGTKDEMAHDPFSLMETLYAKDETLPNTNGHLAVFTYDTVVGNDRNVKLKRIHLAEQSNCDDCISDTSHHASIAVPLWESIDDVLDQWITAPLKSFSATAQRTLVRIGLFEQSQFFTFVLTLEQYLLGTSVSVLVNFSVLLMKHVAEAWWASPINHDHHPSVGATSLAHELFKEALRKEGVTDPDNLPLYVYTVRPHATAAAAHPSTWLDRLATLRMHVQVPPMLASVFTNNVIQQYNEAFRFLLKLVFARVFLTRQWKNEKSAVEVSRKLLHLRMQTNFVIQTTHSFVFSQIAQLCDAFRTSAREAGSVAELRSSHQRFLNAIAHVVLAAQDKQPIAHHLSTILKSATDELTRNIIASAADTDAAFRLARLHHSMGSVISTLSRTNDTRELHLMLTYNNFYT